MKTAIRRIFNFFGETPKIRPKTYYMELAEMGLLDDYLANGFHERFETDAEFRESILDLIYERSPDPSSLLEFIYLERLLHSFSFFQEYTRLTGEDEPDFIR
ncbi:MAG: hypothetical protein ACM3U1_09040 [Chloroflexota bacterium]